MRQSGSAQFPMKYCSLGVPNRLCRPPNLDTSRVQFRPSSSILRKKRGDTAQSHRHSHPLLIRIQNLQYQLSAAIISLSILHHLADIFHRPNIRCVWKFDLSGNIEWLGMLRSDGRIGTARAWASKLVACISAKITSRYFISVNSGS